MSKHKTKEPKPESILVRTDNYRANCSNPCAMADGETPYTNQIHHVLPVSAVKDIKLQNDKEGKKYDYIMDCLWGLGWDINDGDNLIGLPMMSVYITNNGTKPVNFCCHNRDHPQYTEECKQWLHDNIWNRLVAKKKVHELDETKVFQGLMDCIENFKGILKKRAMRPGKVGTLYAYKNRKTLKGWYKAFSMGANPIERAPPANYRGSKALSGIGR